MKEECGPWDVHHTCKSNPTATVASSLKHLYLYLSHQRNNKVINIIFLISQPKTFELPINNAMEYNLIDFYFGKVGNVIGFLIVV